MWFLYKVYRVLRFIWLCLVFLCHLPYYVKLSGIIFKRAWKKKWVRVIVVGTAWIPGPWTVLAIILALYVVYRLGLHITGQRPITAEEYKEREKEKEKNGE